MDGGKPLPGPVAEGYVLPTSVPSASTPGPGEGGGGKNKGKEHMSEGAIKGLPRSYVQVLELVCEDEGGQTQGPRVQPKVSFASFL